MANAIRQPGHVLQFLSIWVSVLKRLRGGSPVSIEARAASFLKALEDGPGVKRDLAVLQLRRDFELVDLEESANIEVVRALQIRFLALAEEYPIVAAQIDERLAKAPISRLFAAIVAQAQSDGATRVEIGFQEERTNVFVVRYLIQNEWQTAMEVPIILFQPVRGFALFVRDATFAKLRQRLHHAEGMPSDLQIEFPDDRTIRIELIA